MTALMTMGRPMKRWIVHAPAYAWLAMGWLSCGLGSTPGLESGFDNPARSHPGALVQVLSPGAPEAHLLVRALRAELIDDFDVLAESIGGDAEGIRRIERLVATRRPQAVILIDNRTVHQYRRWMQTTDQALPHAIILMASHVEDLQPRIVNSTAIAYEVPAITSMVGMRQVLGRPVERVGVVHRSRFSSFVRRQAELASREEIELIGFETGDAPDPGAIAEGLDTLLGRRIDSLWVMNDNALLSQEALRRVWLPFAKRGKVPIVVGVPSLVHATHHMGTFAAVPDTVDLAVQAAELIYELAEEGFPIGAGGTHEPIATRVFLDVAMATRFGVRPEAMEQVDVLVGKR